MTKFQETLDIFRKRYNKILKRDSYEKLFKVEELLEIEFPLRDVK